jgi:hypothetical protein
VLLLAFEDMKLDLPSTVREVAAFIRAPLDNELEQLVVRQASLPFMTEHKDRFDDRLMRERSEQVAGIPPGSDSAKVRSGEVGSGRVELSVDIEDELDRAWSETVGQELGFVSYAALLEAFRAERHLSVRDR